MEHIINTILDDNILHRNKRNIYNYETIKYKDKRQFNKLNQTHNIFRTRQDIITDDEQKLLDRNSNQLYLFKRPDIFYGDKKHGNYGISNQEIMEFMNNMAYNIIVKPTIQYNYGGYYLDDITVNNKKLKHKITINDKYTMSDKEINTFLQYFIVYGQKHIMEQYKINTKQSYLDLFVATFPIIIYNRPYCIKDEKTMTNEKIWNNDVLETNIFERYPNIIIYVNISLPGHNIPLIKMNNMNIIDNLGSWKNDKNIYQYQFIQQSTSNDCTAFVPLYFLTFFLFREYIFPTNKKNLLWKFWFNVNTRVTTNPSRPFADISDFTKTKNIKNNITQDEPLRTANNFFMFSKFVWRRSTYYHAIKYPNDYIINKKKKTFIWK